MTVSWLACLLVSVLAFVPAGLLVGYSSLLYVRLFVGRSVFVDVFQSFSLSICLPVPLPGHLLLTSPCPLIPTHPPPNALTCFSCDRTGVARLVSSLEFLTLQPWQGFRLLELCRAGFH